MRTWIELGCLPEAAIGDYFDPMVDHEPVPALSVGIGRTEQRPNFAARKGLPWVLRFCYCVCGKGMSDTILVSLTQQRQCRVKEVGTREFKRLPSCVFIRPSEGSSKGDRSRAVKAPPVGKIANMTLR
jgi:hypothetical protein